MSSAEVKKSGVEGLFERIKDEAELIAIFLVFLAVLIAHESLIEIHEKAAFKDILKAWLAMLGAALIFFVFVFRVAIKQSRRDVVRIIEEKLGPISSKLSFAVKNIEEGAIHDAIKDGRFLLAESEVMKLESEVKRAVWVVSPDFRYELGDGADANYTGVISKNIRNGVKYNYFVPHDGTTSTYVDRFQSALRESLSREVTDPTKVDALLENVTVVSLSVDKYPATAIFGCALYEIDPGDLAFVEYFPRGAPAWNVVVRDGHVATLAGGGLRNVGPEPSTEIRGTIMLKGRFEDLLSNASKGQRSSAHAIRYYTGAA